MMITPVGRVYVASVLFNIMVSILIAIKTIRQPKKVRYVLLAFSILTLPASIVNALTYQGSIPLHWDSFGYLLSTLFMLALHFWLNLDIGKHLRVGGIQYNSPYIIAGAVGLAGSMICMIIQMFLLLLRNDPYPIRPAFITGVCLAIFCDGATYIYSFSVLIHFKSQRHHEGQSKTTSLGVWFLLIQFVWYSIYGVLYVWFFCNSWDFFIVLLGFDYFMRFILCLMFTWSPPSFVISYMSKQFFSGTSHEDNNDDEHGSTFKMTQTTEQENSMSFYHNSQNYTHHNDLDCTKQDSFYSSDIVTKSCN